LAKYVYTGNVNKSDKTAVIGIKGKQVRLGDVVELSDSEYENLSNRFVLKESDAPQAFNLGGETAENLEEGERSHPGSFGGVAIEPAKEEGGSEYLLETDKEDKVSEPKETPEKSKLNRLFDKGVK
jgi:hypothetical protein